MISLLRKFVAAVQTLVRRRVVIFCDAIPYCFENVSYRKIFNWLAVELSVLSKPLKPWGWPTHLQVEPTNSCNLRCALCPVSGEMQRPRGFMDLDLFRQTMDEIGRHVFLILLWDWGEPFLHPSIFEMISYAKTKGIKVVSSTNGHLFAGQEMADKVIRSGLDTLIFAVDGMTQETYATYRRKGDLETVLDGIRCVVRRKRFLGSETPLVNLRFLVMKHNEREIPRLKDFARSLGVDVLTLKTVNPCINDTYGEKKNATGKESDLLPSDSRYRRFHYEPDGRRLIRRKVNACKNPWNAATIHWNGKVCSCSNDYDERYPLGDLKASGFKDIWFGALYQDMRRRLRANDKDHYFCYECSYAYEGGNCIDEIIADATFFKEEIALK
jgi:radical SAM protein with 4Fe4S-binding SPASM domain